MRRRNAFAEASVENARDAFANNPIVAQYIGAVAAQHLTAICDRIFVANVRDGCVEIPRKYQDTDAIPIVAHAPDEPRFLSAQFGLLTPRRRSQILRQLARWGLQGPAELHLQNIQDTLLQAFLNNTFFSKSFQKGSKAAYVVCGASKVQLDERSFRSLGKPAKLARSRPLVGINYTEDGQTASPATMAHELMHVTQFEAHTLTGLESNKQRKTKAKMCWELQAYHCGAGIAAAWARSEGIEFNNLPPDDLLQLAVDGTRKEVNAGRRDPFDPSGTLYNKLLEIGLDI